MEGTLHAVSNMIEFRDPYTAGHERRVGIIAADIAREMGWTKERCKNLEYIGLVHDIGKIAIPAEILTKPSRLSYLEYEMVKGHAEKGYEVLKDIDFPLPIAEIIRQHHERMDGSGYPRGLKGEEILLEARIIAVADVVESIASHRPYRPALGVDVAIKEIEVHKGSLFDSGVVDALLNLFREKNYQLPA
jgi:putative nucleotidyltransferase with HDIG domain